MQQVPNLQTALLSCEHVETLVGALELLYLLTDFQVEPAL